MKKSIILVAIIVAILVAAILAYAFSGLVAGQGGKIEVPEQIGPFELVSMIKGESARRQIEKMHFGYPGDILDATVAVYKRDDGTLLHLWVSRFSSSEEAEKNIEAMALKMERQPELGFKPVRRLVDGHEVYVAIKGGIHAFWAQGEDTYYILLPIADEDEALDVAATLIKGAS